MTFQLYKPHFIHKVVIHHVYYTGWDFDEYCKPESKFIECIEEHTDVEVSVYKGDIKQKSCGVLSLNYGLKKSDQVYNLFCNTEGDKIKLTKSSGQIVIYEIAITSTRKCHVI